MASNKAMLFPFIAFRPKVANYCLVYYKDDLFYCESWSRGSVPSSHARGQRFEPQRRQYFKLLLDPGDFHSNPSGLLSFNKSETVLWTIAKILLLLLLNNFTLV